MATKHDDSAAENGKPSRNSPAPVIRRLADSGEDSRTRLLKRQVPAWVISGLIHVAGILAFIAFSSVMSTDTAAKEKEKPASTKMDEPPVAEPDLTNPDVGLDSDLVAAVDVEKVTDTNVEAKEVENETAGLPNQDKEFASQTSQLAPMNDVVADAGVAGVGEGLAMVGQGGGGGELALPGMKGRSGATKEKLLRSGGGGDETEAAVGRALVWLAKQQTRDGYWEYDGSHKADRIAATGMAVLPFLAAGETHVNGKKYKSHVAKGLAYLQAKLKANGQFGDAGMYTQAIGTIALCEAAGMTQDDGLKRNAKKAVGYVVAAQAGNGSWGYTSGTDGDTSVVGWQIQALKSAKLAGIAVPDKSFKQAESFLVSVSDDSESRYGYRTKGGTPALSAVGLLSRIYISGNPKHALVARGVKNMWEENKPTEGNWDMYYYYYATQVVHFFDGKAWHADWNPTMRKILLDKQVSNTTPGAKAADVGSWPKDTGFIGSSCGKLGTTCLACLTLEVYYRHLPLNKRDGGGLMELEKGN